MGLLDKIFEGREILQDWGSEQVRPFLEKHDGIRDFFAAYAPDPQKTSEDALALNTGEMSRAKWEIRNAARTLGGVGQMLGDIALGTFMWPDEKTFKDIDLSAAPLITNITMDRGTNHMAAKDNTIMLTLADGSQVEAQGTHWDHNTKTLTGRYDVDGDGDFDVITIQRHKGSWQTPEIEIR